MTNSADSDSDHEPFAGDVPTSSPDGELPVTHAADAAGTIASDGRDTSPVAGLEEYELIEELGRGGMGVVYRARHKTLGRSVALKMILAGQFASPESIQRFTLEAESAARLDHRGIVPIYEIGKAGEHHFYAMKLIDGSPLSALLSEYEPDQRKSAALVVQIAEAVQHAHQRGVLHRDLKPANILIDGDGAPWITDLGLAKQLDSESAITQTGLVIGSPGFMSPEQAAGMTDTTVATDVYAMGAILYWLISGRPPISGKSTLEVVQKTIEQEPESIRRLRRDADRDLNLICLKALEKAPQDRYRSAAEFATELQAWLDGEPLMVKPPSPVQSTYRWLRKNVRGVAVGVACGTVAGLVTGFILLVLVGEQLLDSANEIQSKLASTREPWITTSMAWIQRLPPSLSDARQWIMLITTSIGIATIGLSKPKQRESGVAAALTASLLAGILAFIISWAWQPIGQRTASAAEEDMQLLAEYFFLHPDDRHLAEQTLFDRYPGIEQVESWKRSDLLLNKMSVDQVASIPLGVFVAVGGVLFLVVLPIFVSSLFAGLIWGRGYRGWGFFWRSIEVGLLSSVLLFLLSRSFGNFVGPPPLLAYQVVSLVTIGITITVALSRRTVFLRVPLFLFALVTCVANLSDSNHVQAANWHARIAETDGQYRRAASLLERKLANSNERVNRFHLATLYAYLGDDDKYVEHCEQLVRHGNFYNREVAEQASKAMLLKPDLHQDIERAHQLARWASEQRAFNGWDYLCRALSEVRQGNVESARQWAEKSRNTAASQSQWQQHNIVATAHLVDAIGYQMANERSKVDESLGLAEKSFKTDSVTPFEVTLTYRILRSEVGQDSQGN